jgi:hypothetical protein
MRRFGILCERERQQYRIDCGCGTGLRKFLLRYGQRPEKKMTPWTLRYLEWIKKEVTFEEEALQWTLEEYMNEVEHCSLRITRLDGLSTRRLRMRLRQ